jgi:hypothetical protein
MYSSTAINEKICRIESKKYLMPNVIEYSGDKEST